MFKVLHDVTVAQDITNLIIREEVIELSKLKGSPEHILAFGYAEEKVNKLKDKLYMLKSKYRKD